MSEHTMFEDKMIEENAIQTWTLPQYVKEYFGGKVNCWKVESNLYMFRGTNKKVFLAATTTAQDARERVKKLVAIITDTEDGRVKKH